MEGTPIEERRLALEERRVVAEERRLKQEAKWGWITRLGVAIPLIVLVATLIYDRDRAREQAEEESQRLIEQASVDAQLSAIEIILNQESPQQAYATAQAMADLELHTVGVPDVVPLAVKTLDVDAGSKEAFINLIAAHSDDRAVQRSIKNLWRVLFPTDDWVDDVVIPSDR